MDYELLFSLCILWIASTVCLFACAFMWIYNEGEGFHPHSVSMERRHSLYSVVSANTVCKYDFVVKSISEFIAPRGSSSDKYFTTLLVMGAVAGFLGCVRWHSVGDATYFEASLGQAGFFFLIVVAMFEVDVSPQLFLEEKLIITAWLIEGMKLSEKLNFPVSQYSPEFLKMLVESDEVKHLYEEYDGKMEIRRNFLSFVNFNFSLHMLGASLYICLITAAVIMNEHTEWKIAWITGISFFGFGSLGYLTGSYFPTDPWTRRTILLWNPFCREKDFLLKLQLCIENYNQKEQLKLVNNDDNLSSVTSKYKYKSKSRNGTPLKRRKSLRNKLPTSECELSEPEPESDSQWKRKQKFKAYDAKEIQRTSICCSGTNGKCANNDVFTYTRAMHDVEASFLSKHYIIRQAYKYPKQYLLVMSHIFMTIELIAFETPMIAMGIQWITALCGSTPPVSALLGVFFTIFECVVSHDFKCEALQESCILTNSTRYGY